MKRFTAIISALIVSLVATTAGAQVPAFDENATTVEWSASAERLEGDLYRLTLTGDITEGWHTYRTDNPYSPTEVTFADAVGYTLDGAIAEPAATRDYDGDPVYFDKIVLTQNLRLTAAQATVKGEVMWIACVEGACHSPEYWEFEVVVGDASAAVAPAVEGDAQSVEPAEDMAATGESIAAAEPESPAEKPFSWALIIEAVIWGFAALLTPCVFPMVPMTVSFFMKGSSSVAAGRFKALMYGLFIVLLYVVPIAVIKIGRAHV